MSGSFVRWLPPFVLAIFGKGLCARTGCGRPARRWYCSDACGNADRQQRFRDSGGGEPPPPSPPSVEMEFHATIAEWCFADDEERFRHIPGVRYKNTRRGWSPPTSARESDENLVRTLLEKNGAGGEL